MKHIIYGILILIFIYVIIHMLYSVYYTPGVNTLYDSPITQLLFPNENRIFPTWGSDMFGMYDFPYQFGQGSFWPRSGKGYVPNKLGYGGASPTGIRPTFPIPNSTSVGFWGNTPTPERNVQLDIYDRTAQGTQYIIPVGWWGN